MDFRGLTDGLLAPQLSPDGRIGRSHQGHRQEVRQHHEADVVPKMCVTVILSGIRTRIVSVLGWHADHLPPRPTITCFCSPEISHLLQSKNLAHLSKYIYGQGLRGLLQFCRSLSNVPWQFATSERQNEKN